MITVDEAMNHARNELERAFEKWLTDECPSGDCESVQEQWDDSFAHQELVDELQPVMALTWEVHQLREEAANDSIQIELLEHKLESFREENERQRFDILAMNQSLDLLREENERLRKDAGRYRWLRDSDYDIGELFQHIQAHGLTNTGIDAAIDAARGEK